MGAYEHKSEIGCLATPVVLGFLFALAMACASCRSHDKMASEETVNELDSMDVKETNIVRSKLEKSDVSFEWVMNCTVMSEPDSAGKQYPKAYVEASGKGVESKEAEEKDSANVARQTRVKNNGATSRHSESKSGLTMGDIALAMCVGVALGVVASMLGMLAMMRRKKEEPP